MMTEDRPFTYGYYEKLLQSFKDNGYSFRFFGDVLKGKAVLMRHDVDFSPSKALRMGEFEFNHGIRSTYFFLVDSSFYSVCGQETLAFIRGLTAMGHRIGLQGGTFSAQRMATNVLPKRISINNAICARLLA